MLRVSISTVCNQLVQVMCFLGVMIRNLLIPSTPDEWLRTIFWPQILVAKWSGLNAISKRIFVTLGSM